MTGLALALALAAGDARAASIVELTIRDGRVWLVSHDATTQEILAEWGRVGQTTVVGADRASDTRVTLELSGVPEPQALDVLLRSASGFVARRRADASPPLHAAGQSRFDRIVVLPITQVPIAVGPDTAPVLKQEQQQPTTAAGASMPPGFSPPPQAPPRRVSPAQVSPAQQAAPPPQQAYPPAQAPGQLPPKAAPGVPVPGMIVPAPQALQPQAEPQHPPGRQPPGPQPRRPFS